MIQLIEKNRVYLVYVPLTLYWLLLFAATSIPGSDLPAMRLSDKLLHFGAFSVLGFLLDLTARVQNKNTWIRKNNFVFSYVVILIYGALDEIHQYFIPGRSADYMDWLADMVGALFGVLLLNLVLSIDQKLVLKIRSPDGKK